jgi:hypothetical protein
MRSITLSTETAGFFNSKSSCSGTQGSTSLELLGAIPRKEQQSISVQWGDSLIDIEYPLPLNFTQRVLRRTTEFYCRSRRLWLRTWVCVVNLRPQVADVIFHPTSPYLQ